MASTRVALLILVPVAMGCSGSPGSTIDVRVVKQSPTSAPSVAPVASVAPKPSREIGAPCSSDKDPSECRANYTCGPLPGGYCTKWCSYGETCGDGATCVPTVRAGEVCLDTCATNDDCRVDQGYTCDASFKVCIVPGFAGTRPPQCAGAPPKPRAKFGEAKEISTPHASKYAFEPTAALMPNGDLVVAYTAMNAAAEPNGLETVVIESSGTISAPRALTSDRKRHFDPWMTTFRDEAVLVWLGHDGGRPDRNPAIGLSFSKNGRDWSAPIDVLAEPDCPNKTSGCADKPMIVGVPAKGKRPASLAVLYYSEVTEGLRARVSTDGKTFGDSVAALPSAYGDIFTDAGGTLHAVAQNFSAGSGHPNLLGDARGMVEWVSSADGGATWSAPQKVSADGHGMPFFFSNPQIVVDEPRKRLHVAYPMGTGDGRWDIVLRTSTDGGKTWTATVVNDDGSCANHMKPTAALDPKTGELHLIWADNRDGKGRMIYAVCNGSAGITAKCGPNEALSAPFASYGFVRHAPAWLGEYDVLILDEKRRVLHAVWTAPVLEGTLATSRVFHATAKL